jgi:hypothetical protein
MTRPRTSTAYRILLPQYSAPSARLGCSYPLLLRHASLERASISFSSSAMALRTRGLPNSQLSAAVNSLKADDDTH